ncbi:GNAT family N-acetyltransferase [Streptomyces sp. NPDC053741]|uniref:Lysine N-acyltransferase MbtK n=2 Tax=Streptomyces TaxID=1883 RepID=A0ABZ1K2Y0_9ACTN|nr:MULTISPECIES: GNAT family N-acetyltransferase [Streptomyces]MDF9872271.1 RimJ/RimL family protein N-acetyltransferase [Streptomyces pratensis]RAS36271.1 RimJ/RimL family protein N-acetyltransferase [Streptomyces avidinii]SNX72011.1 Protein N-acetyltransferase, RimJ/RimL family [Streptomyces microflavus]AGJ55095.1 desferrioxamine E biosynthesis protein DesC @ Siderophore synthetase small component, acetyltransferase [Streptomyces sp. PAMC 26508]MDX2621843.1 GNAT family N-acetyltransferase [S
MTRTRRIGAFSVRPMDPSPGRRGDGKDGRSDSELVHEWVTHPRSAFWMMGDARLEDIEREYTAIAAHPHHDAFIGLHEGRPAFLMERYDPTEVELEGLYEAEPGDIGMHFLVAPPETPVHGFTLAVITTVMETLFADPGVRRVVVEPDVTNHAVQALNKAVGFEVIREITKPEKQALLSACTREQFEAATTGAER